MNVRKIFYLIFFCLLAVHLVSGSQINVKTKVENSYVVVGVSLENFTGKLALGSFLIKYDPNHVEFVEYDKTLNGYIYAIFDEYKEVGIIKMSLYNVSPQILRNPTLFSLVFECKEGSFSDEWVNVTALELRDYNGNVISTGYKYISMENNITIQKNVHPEQSSKPKTEITVEQNSNFGGYADNTQKNNSENKVTVNSTVVKHEKSVETNLNNSNSKTNIIPESSEQKVTSTLENSGESGGFAEKYFIGGFQVYLFALSLIIAMVIYRRKIW
ncbi:hypothetical protein Asulf_01870 [Archaeoglobus sulfaticallidus PM70-1]|uniref:Cohesin domain-containing protein n=1 Tax=Archaeoglobus sulfaticallidus PM70-1 TaxID=387631 RepID=N0BMH8_9EURY|nr:hypothetical protein [Archaeoglobus sulfaticallidus]AGK61836.1 hypothetical protein Asulf_01870 [Archaeoglobus sulfaticallidus PM70-1]